jgi:hypothetical protein
LDETVDIELLDFAFGVVTTLALGILTVFQFVGDHRRRRFEDTQIALDIQASLTTREIVELLAKPTLSTSDRDFLTYVHGVALDRQNAMTAFNDLKPEVRDAVLGSIKRVYAVVQSDEGARSRQKAADATFHTNVVDRTKFTWGDDPEKLGKWDVLALAGAQWLREHPEITTRAAFDEAFGSVVRPVVEPHAAGGPFNPRLLLQQVVHPGQKEGERKKGERWLASHGDDGVIRLDGETLRTGWRLGFGSTSGGAAHLAMIDHFRKVLGYDIRSVD